MRHNFRIPAAAAAVALGLAMAGCGGDEGPTTPSPASPAPAPVAASGAALGGEEAAGPFQVTLTTEPAEPKVGDTLFRARVTRDGSPVTGADITLGLSMPSMNMGGPEATLKASASGGPGTYEGTANLSMGGEYQANVAVGAGGETGSATYTFMAMQ